MAALQMLCEAVQRCAPDTDDEERRFVEGAGAYFALVLIDHLGEAEHRMREGVHCLHVGAHGAIDPFACVTRVLEADDVRRAFIDEVAFAEAEACGKGPVARVVRELHQQLSQLPGAEVAERFDRKLWVQTQGTRIELDLTRVIDVTRGESDATVQSAVRRLVAALSPNEGDAALPWTAARERLFPRLVGPAFIEALGNRQGVHLLRLTTEVWVTLVLRYKERARYVRQDEVDSWSRDGAAPRAQALHNLAHSCARARFLQHDTPHGAMVIAESRDGLDSARLLLPGLHTLLARELGSPFVVGVPHRDTLLACALGPSKLLATLQERVEEAALRAPHAIAHGLLLVSESGEIRDFSATGRGDADATNPGP
ncbi:MAG TPA: hypothetical protein VF331_15830 [Polyangiales bacterium]